MSMLGTLIDRPDHLGSHAAVGTYAAADETFDDNSSAIAWARQAYGDFLAHGILPKDAHPTVADGTCSSSTTVARLSETFIS
jgi:hypothetical protein